MIRPIEVDLIIAINQRVCGGCGETFLVRDRGLIESAIHAAYYPGSPPYINGGLSGVVGALGYSLIKNHCFENGNKRTAVLVMTLLFKTTGYKIVYPGDAFTDIVEKIARSNANQFDKSKKELVEWMDYHKMLI